MKKSIDRLSTEIDGLQIRLEKIDSDYTRLKPNIDFDNSKEMEQLKALKAEKDLILELIEEKQEKIIELHNDMDIQAKKESREQTINERIDLAKQAEQFENEFHQKFEDLDKLLSEKIPEIIKIKQEWEKTAKDFMNLGDQTLGNGLRQSTSYSKVKNGQADQLTDEALLKELSSMGVNLKAVTSGEVLSTQHFTHVSNTRETDLFFGDALFGMLNQSNIYKLLNENETAKKAI